MTGPLLTFGGTAVGVAVLVGLALYATGTGVTQEATQQVGLDGTATQPTTTSPAPYSQEPGRVETNDDATDNSDEATDSTGSVGAVGEQPPGDGVNTTTSTTPVTPEPSVSTAPDPTPEPLDLLAPERLPADAPQDDGVYGIVGGQQLGRLAGFIVVDELIFTNGAAVEGRTEVALGSPDGWTTATVIGIDTVTDVAVLTAVDPAHLDHARPTALAADGRETGSDQPGLGNRVELATEGDEGPIRGIVTATDQPATGRAGQMIYGALRTSIPYRDDAAGAALVDSKGGHLVGLVIGSDDPLLSAIPLPVLRHIGQSFVEVGEPALEWLGVRGSVHSDGGVIITEIIGGGPAASHGLLAGEVIVAVDDEPVENMNHLAHLIRRAGADAAVRVQVASGDRTRTVEVTIGTHPSTGQGG